MPPIPAGEGTCATCHQRHLTEEEHGLFTSQPIGDAEAGAASFAELCESCHGEDGTTAVGDQGSVISSEAYLSTHDDADILKDIGIGSHGEATAFAQEYGGPLSWEEILDLAAFVRSWGSYSGAPSEGELTYPDTIAPLLAERCGECHGGIAGLTVTDYESVMTGGDSGPAVVPGSPDESPIVEVQREGHYAQLSEMELNLLIEWIAGGALER
jgi:cytochrome c553